MWSSALEEGHIWQRRFYDFVVFTEHRRAANLDYMPQNPVRSGLVLEPQQWACSSFRHYEYGEPGTVPVNEAQRAALQMRKTACNWRASNGNWGNFDLDPDSNWVGLTDDRGNLQQASCTGNASSCTYSALGAMGSDYEWGLAGHVNSQGGYGQNGHLTFDNPWYHRNGCGQSLTVLGIGVVTTAAAGAAVAYLGPAALELAGEGADGIETLLNIGHTAEALGPMVAAPLTIAGVGAKGVDQNCF